MLHELIDLALEVGDRVERAAADRLGRDQREPTLDLVEPRTVGRREMQVEPWPAGEPSLDFGVLVRAVVVADQVHVKVFRDVRFDVSQESQEFLVTVLGLALREHRAVRHIKRGEQRRRAVAHVVVSRR